MFAGLSQLGGVAMGVCSFVFPRRWLERDPVTTLRHRVSPGGLALAGEF